MKDYYKINEISKLYGIGVDSLRYYEKLGILKPKRDTNGYRLYNLKDIYKLNMIRDLRRLNFSMAQIKEYLEGQSVSNTLEMLYREQKLLHEQKKELEARETIIAERISALNAAKAIKPGIITVKSFPERRCVQLNEHITRDEEMDFVIKKLHRRHENKIRDFGNQTIGAFFSMEDLKQGVSNAYNSVFFILEEGSEDYDFLLPAGEYLSCYYRGSYEQNGERIYEIFRYAKENGYATLCEPFELYEIDNRDTIQQEEFLTEIQVRVQITGCSEDIL